LNALVANIQAENQSLRVANGNLLLLSGELESKRAAAALDSNKISGSGNEQMKDVLHENATCLPRKSP